MQVTLLGFELDIVDRWTVEDPPPLTLRRPARRRLKLAEYDEPMVYPDGMIEEEYRYEGAGIYKRVR